MTAELTTSSCVIAFAAWGPVASNFEPGANLTSIIIALLGLVPVIFGIRNQRRSRREREQSDPPPAKKSDPDVTDHDLPSHHRPGDNPRTNRK